MLDMHVHSSFSADSSHDMDEYLYILENKGLGFCEHLDFMPYCNSFNYLDSKRYISRVKRLKNKGYRIFSGVEVDYHDSVEKDIIINLETYKYDYTICSVHVVNKTGISDDSFVKKYLDDDRIVDIIHEYYYQIQKSIESELFDIIGHIGIYKKYFPEGYFNKYSDIIDKHEKEIAILCSKSKAIIEVNTSGLFKSHKETMPSMKFLKEYFDNGGRLICLSSDAHSPSLTYKGFLDTANKLKKIGFDRVTYPRDIGGDIL